MKRRLIEIGVLLATSVLVFIVAYNMGRNSVLIAEFKVAQTNLLKVEGVLPGPSSATYSEDLKQYIRGRYYYFGNLIPKRWLPLTPDDRLSDPVAFTPLTVGKGATTSSVEFNRFKKRLSE